VTTSSITTSIDTFDVYSRGLTSLDSLDDFERLVFILVEFETRIDMEGWDDFFTSEFSFPLYPEMKNWLHKIGDHRSLAVLLDYEFTVVKAGFIFERSAIAQWVMSLSDQDLAQSPDWRENYTKLSGQRWAAVARFLERRGVRLNLNEPTRGITHAR
jgi:hypothetical protein